jgi:Arc/MetJ-type ribon-helix-helix transcriptional regulator
MANPFIAVRITPDLDAAIAQRVKETGQSKSDVVIEALKTYLGILPQAHRLADIEQRLSALEASAESPEESSSSNEHFSP